MCDSNKHRTLVSRSGKRSTRALPDPIIPLADPIDGLLTLDDLLQPITVSLAVWDDALPNDTYQLLWNDVETGIAKPVDTDLPGASVSLEIPAELLTGDGTYQVKYRARDVSGGQFTDSPFTSLIVDHTPPGGALVAAMVFPAVVQDGVLTSAELAALGDVLTAEVPGYTGMAWGDTIHTFWGTVAGPTHLVTQPEVDNERVMLDFPRAFLESLGDVAEPVYYYVIDRAGNKSINSQDKTFALFLQEVPDDFPAPLCVQATDGLIDDDDARATVAVDIPQYSGAQAGDKVMLYWGANPLAEVPVQTGDIAQDPMFSINVRYATIALSGDGVAALRYEVRRNDVLIGSSLELPVNVNLTLPGPQDPDPETPENEALALPIIRGTSGNVDNQDNVIDEDDFLLEAKAIIAWRDGLVISDVITLYWGSQATPVVFPIKSTDLNNDLVLTVPNALITAEGTGETIKVYYTVTHSGRPNTSLSAAQSIAVRSQGDLPGGINGLPSPVFSNANESNAISPILSPDGTPVFIPPYEHIEKYPRVTMVFHGYNAANGNTPVPGASVESTHVLDEFEMVNGYSFRVSDAKLRLICSGRADAYFRVEGPNGPVNSPTTPVMIRMSKPGVGC